MASITPPSEKETLLKVLQDNARFTFWTKFALQTTGFLYGTLLAANIRFAMVTQPIQQFNTLFWLISRSNETYASRNWIMASVKTTAFYRQFTTAMAKYLKSGVNELWGRLHKEGTVNFPTLHEFVVGQIEKSKFFSPHQKELIMWGIKEGWIGNPQWKEFLLSSAAESILMALPEMSEMVNRIQAVLAADYAARGGKLNINLKSEDEIRRFVRSCAMSTQYPYLWLNRPQFARTPIGVFLYFLQSYAYNTMYLIQNIGSRKLRAAIEMWLFFMLTSGVFGMPGGWLAMLFLRLFFQKSGLSGMARELYGILRNNDIKNRLLRALAFGAPSLIGVPGYTVWGVSDPTNLVIPAMKTRVFALAAEVIENIMQGHQPFASMPNIWDALVSMSPPIIPLPVKSSLKALVTKWNILPGGFWGRSKVYPSDINKPIRLFIGEEPQKDVSRVVAGEERLSNWELLLRIMGITPMTEMNWWHRLWVMRMTRSVYNEYKGKNKNLIAEYLYIIQTTDSDKERQKYEQKMSDVVQRLASMKVFLDGGDWRDIVEKVERKRIQETGKEAK